MKIKMSPLLSINTVFGEHNLDKQPKRLANFYVN